MKTLLLISSESTAHDLERLQALPGVRVIARRSVADAATALTAGVFDLALVIVDPVEADASVELERLRQLAPRLSVLAGVESPQLLAAYAAGADAALPWPSPLDVVFQLVERWLASGAGVTAGPTPTRTVTPWPSPPVASPSPLETLRDFSKVLSHALDERSLAQRLVEQLAEILGVVRIALFLEPDSQPQPMAAVALDPRLACAASIGIPGDVTSCLELSRDGGVGKLMTQRRGVFLRHAPHVHAELQSDSRIMQEFDVLGCDLAVSIHDRERVVGVAVLGERITGQAFTTEELNLAYFLMGELGMAVRNSRLHRTVTLNHQLLSSILESITSGSLVVGPDLRVLHANRAASSLMGISAGKLPSATDLPPTVLQVLHAVARQGATTEPILHERTGGAGARLVRYSLIPLQGGGPAAPARPVIVLMEDWTNVHAAKQAEIESANTRLITTIAARFAHEIRNSLVPLSTHSQLFESQRGEPSFLDSLRASLHRETLRIRRLSDQMVFLAGADSASAEVFPIAELLPGALAGAREITGRVGELVVTGDQDLRVRGARSSLVYALQEIFANSLQAVTGPATIRVNVQATTGEGVPAAALEISDNGAGFTAEAATRATEPFYTTRTTGVGLGLAVARKIVEVHGGHLAIQNRTRPGEPDIRVILPAP